MTTFDPHVSTENNDVIYNVFEGLYRFTPDGTIELALADNVDVSEDGLVHTFHLRDGVTFHDGTPLTSADVKFSLERVKAVETHQTPRISAIETIEAPSPETVVLRLNRVEPLLPNVLAWGSGSVIPEKYFTEVGEDGFNLAPVGTGPFRFETAVPGISVSLSRFDDYWGEPARLAGVDFSFVSEASARQAQLQAGEVDLADFVDLTQVDSLRDQGLNVILHEKTGSTFHAVFQGTFEPFADVRVRQALNYAIDKQGIADTLFLGEVAVVGQPISPGIIGYAPDVGPYPYDPDRAIALLEEAGFDMTTPIELSVPIGRWQRGEEIAEVIASDLRRLGLNIELTRQDRFEWTDTGLAGNFPPITLGKGSVLLLDPMQTLTPWFTCEGAFSQWCDGTLDAAFTEIAGLSGEERIAAIEQLMLQMHDDPPAIFLFSEVTAYGAQTSVNFEPAPGLAFRLFQRTSISGA